MLFLIVSINNFFFNFTIAYLYQGLTICMYQTKTVSLFLFWYRLDCIIRNMCFLHHSLSLLGCLTIFRLYKPNFFKGFQIIVYESYVLLRPTHTSTGWFVFKQFLTFSNYIYQIVVRIIWSWGSRAYEKTIGWEK